MFDFAMIESTKRFNITAYSHFNIGNFLVMLRLTTQTTVPQDPVEFYL